MSITRYRPKVEANSTSTNKGYHPQVTGTTSQQVSTGLPNAIQCQDGDQIPPTQ